MSVDIACVYVLLSRDCFTVLYLVFTRNICVGQASETHNEIGTGLPRGSARLTLVSWERAVSGVGGFVISLLICPFSFFFFLLV
jgi:hypothetical protein